MKTKEEWHNSLYQARHGQMELITQDEIEQIQLDAIKHGMTLAAETIHKMPVKTKHIQAASDLTQAILTARDNLKEIPK